MGWASRTRSQPPSDRRDAAPPEGPPERWSASGLGMRATGAMRKNAKAVAVSELNQPTHRPSTPTKRGPAAGVAWRM